MLIMLLCSPTSLYSQTRSPINSYLASREYIIDTLVDHAVHYYPTIPVTREWAVLYMKDVVQKLLEARSRYPNFEFRVFPAAGDVDNKFIEISTQVQFKGDDGHSLEVLTYFDSANIIIRKRGLNKEGLSYADPDMIGMFTIPQSLDTKKKE